MTPPPLPIDAHLAEVRAALHEHRAAVLVGPPGSGKTTRVPAALSRAAPVFLLQPRRVAARAIARRIAEEQRLTLGEEVGWQVRFERRFSPRTRLLVATEGILTRRLQSDPLLSDFGVLVLDEFHERSVHADLALALGREVLRARDDFSLLVMSATLDPGPVRSFLGGCPLVRVDARPHPVEVGYAPGRSVVEAVADVCARPGGHVLCFLPGAAEIRRAAADLGQRMPDLDVRPLHGSLSPDEQDLALGPSASRKVVLATNIAETSLTVDGVTDVIDSGLQKVLRYDAARGLDRLELERVSEDSAEQRAGRAGRTGPGRVLRLWDPRDRLRPRREPEIQRVDLAGPALAVLGWGGDPARFGWFEAPPPGRLEAALRLLQRMGVVEEGRLTAVGAAVERLPLHPRLARVLVAAGGSARAAAVCAVLAEGWWPSAGGDAPTTDSDALLGADMIRSAPPAIRDAARQLEGLARGLAAPGADGDQALLRALLAGFPDRVARRREPGSPRLVMASGQGARLGRESGVRGGELLVALEVAAGAAGAGGEAVVRAASRVERSWLDGVRTAVVHRFDDSAGRVRAAAQDWYDALLVDERPLAADPVEAAPLLVAALERRGLGPAGERLTLRLRLAGIEVDVAGLARRACEGRTDLPAVDDPARWLEPGMRAALDRLAPERISLPSGRTARVDYRSDGSVVVAAKLQELFGLAESPRLGAKKAPVVFELLAPNGRPVQTTRDLRSFWDETYPAVRRELRGRYPKHPWPEDPWVAQPTHRTRRRA